MPAHSVTADGNEPAGSARLFFAFWPSPAMQAALAAAADAVVLETEKSGSAVSRVPAANFHLTLAFLGSVAVNRLPEVDDVAVRCAQAAGLHETAIEIVLDAIEHWRKAQVLVATASETPPIAVALAETLKHALVEAGFSPDLKPFRVHATIARKVRRVSRELQIDPVRWRFSEIALAQSQTLPAGSVYTVLKRYAFT